VVGVLFAFLIISQPERSTTSSVNAKFRLLGPSDKIVVDGFDGPKVEGVACHIARAQTGRRQGHPGRRRGHQRRQYRVPPDRADRARGRSYLNLPTHQRRVISFPYVKRHAKKRQRNGS
jgi:hypothetical protein